VADALGDGVGSDGSDMFSPGVARPRHKISEEPRIVRRTAVGSDATRPFQKAGCCRDESRRLIKCTVQMAEGIMLALGPSWKERARTENLEQACTCDLHALLKLCYTSMGL